MDPQFNSQYLVENDDNLQVATQKSSQDFSLWNIDDDLFFYPLGLTNHGSGSKTVFVVWCENYLLNFIIKKSSKTDDVAISKFRVAMPFDEKGKSLEEITDILILPRNTLLRMLSGNIYFFRSVKVIKRVTWLNNVYCISAAQHGFSVIRLLSDNSLSLEIYDDNTLREYDTKPLQSFDITFVEHDVFNSNWREEKFRLISCTLETTEHVLFMQSLIGDGNKLNLKQEIHVFAVLGNIFALIPTMPEDPETVNFNIELLNSYASSVENIIFDFQRQLCLVVLDCGTIDIWYISKAAGAIQRKSHRVGTQFLDYDYDYDHAHFYYTDEENVVQLKLVYSKTLDSYLVQEDSKPVPGIVACTWVKNIQQFICLSSNNIFYYIEFEDKECNAEFSTEEENINKLYGLTKEKVVELMGKADIVDEMIKMPEELKKDIELEFAKQELIRVASKAHLYQTLFEATLQYSKHITRSADIDTTFVYVNSNAPISNINIYAIITINVEGNEIFHNALWNLRIDYEEKCYQITLPKLLSKMCFVVPFGRFASTSKLLPKFQINLHTFVTNNMDHMVISLPLKLEINSQTFKDLFNHNNEVTATTFYSSFNLEKLFQKMSKESTGITQHKSAMLSHLLKLPESISFKHIIGLFSSLSSKIDDELEWEIYFLGSRVCITFLKEENVIKLESYDVLALFYTELHMKLHFDDEEIYTNDTVIDIDYKTEILKLQCNVERCYGAMGESVTENFCLKQNHLEILTKTYEKLRALPWNIF